MKPNEKKEEMLNIESIHKVVLVDEMDMQNQRRKLRESNFRIFCHAVFQSVNEISSALEIYKKNPTHYYLFVCSYKMLPEFKKLIEQGKIKYDFTTNFSNKCIVLCHTKKQVEEIINDLQMMKYVFEKPVRQVYHTCEMIYKIDKSLKDVLGLSFGGMNVDEKYELVFIMENFQKENLPISFPYRQCKRAQLDQFLQKHQFNERYVLIYMESEDYVELKNLFSNYQNIKRVLVLDKDRKINSEDTDPDYQIDVLTEIQQLKTRLFEACIIK